MFQLQDTCSFSHQTFEGFVSFRRLGSKTLAKWCSGRFYSWHWEYRISTDWRLCTTLRLENLFWMCVQWYIVHTVAWFLRCSDSISSLPAKRFWNPWICFLNWHITFIIRVRQYTLLQSQCGNVYREMFLNNYGGEVVYYRSSAGSCCGDPLVFFFRCFSGHSVDSATVI